MSLCGLLIAAQVFFWARGKMRAREPGPIERMDAVAQPPQVVEDV
jgi:hypothetical protein